MWKLMITASTQNILSYERFFTFSILFPLISYFLLKNMHCCLLWAVDRWECCGRHLVRTSPPGAWPTLVLPPGAGLTSLSGSLSQQAPSSAIHDNPVPCATFDSLYFVLNSESLKSPRTGLGHGSRACLPAGTWPATRLGLPRHLPHFCPSQAEQASHHLQATRTPAQTS